MDQGESLPTDWESDEDLSGDFNVRVSSGPLASRSASPLGPALATMLTDQAPTVDRHERALSQSIEESESELESESRKRDLEYAELAVEGLALDAFIEADVHRRHLRGPGRGRGLPVESDRIAGQE